MNECDFCALVEAARIVALADPDTVDDETRNAARSFLRAQFDSSEVDPETHQDPEPEVHDRY